MTTINVTVRNPATKQETIVSRFKATRARKHGRNRNVGKVWKVRRLETPVQTRGAEASATTRDVSHPLGLVEAQPPRKIKDAERVQKEV
jgi:hypothetical protein